MRRKPSWSVLLGVSLCVLPLLSGCNAGVAGLIILLADDDDDDDGEASAILGLEFIGLENARSRPDAAVVVLDVSGNDTVQLRFEFAELTGDPLLAGESRPMTLISPLAGELTSPGVLDDVPVSPDGLLHRIGWNALADLGGDELRRVRLRVSGDPGTVIADVLVGNDAPEILSVEFSQEPGGEVEVAVEVADSSSDPVDVLVEYATPSVPGEPEPEFRVASTPGLGGGLPSSEDGLVVEFLWDVVTDVGPFDRPAQIRLTLTDQVDGGSGKSGATFGDEIFSDGNVSPRADIAEDVFVSSPDARRGIALDVVAVDVERNPVDLIVQWASDDAPFPELDESLDEDADARDALLRDAAARRELQIVSLGTSVLEGVVDAPADVAMESGGDEEDSGAGGSLAPHEVQVTWLRTHPELRGSLRRLEGRPVELSSPDSGEPQIRRVCEYDALRGVLQLDAALDPPAQPGSRVLLEVGGDGASQRLASGPEGEMHRLIWDTARDFPGGGRARLRATPFDLVVTTLAQECDDVTFSEDPTIRPGARGVDVETGSAKRVRGPFAADDPWVIPLLALDRPAALEAADIDGDGTTDLVYVADFANAAVVLRQTAPGVFDPLRLLDETLSEPSDVVAADFDADGLLDLAFTGATSSTLRILLQSPDLDFFSRRELVSLSKDAMLARPVALVAGDFGTGGVVDLAVGGQGGIIAILGRSASGWQVSQRIDLGTPGLRALASADLDGSGGEDLVAAGDGFLAVISDPGAGGSEVPMILDLPGAQAHDVSVVDFDGDGDLDLVAPDRANGSVILARQGDVPGDFELLPPLEPASLQAPVGVTAGDFDGDGRGEFAVVDEGESGSFRGGGVSVFAAAADGSFSTDRLETPAAPGEVSASPTSVVTADIDGDGIAELATADHRRQEVTVFFQSAAGAFRGGANPLGEDPLAASSVAAGDVDGDGQTDLLVAENTGGLVLLRQTAGGDFLSRAIEAPVDGARAAAVVGDVDGDGLRDVVTADLDADSLTVLLQDAQGSFPVMESLTAPGFLGPHDLALGDIDGDGRTDIAAAGRIGGGVQWFRGLAGESPDGALFEEGGGLLSETGAAAVVLEDLNLDGRLDVATAPSGEARAMVFLQSPGEERGLFESPVEIPLAANGSVVAMAAGDATGDGRLDLVVLISDAVMLIATPDTGETAPVQLASLADGSPADLALRDLNGDDRLDFAVGMVAQAGSFVRLVYQGEAKDFSDASTKDLASGDLEVPVALLAADLDGDGEADIVSANRGSRNVTVFFGGR